MTELTLHVNPDDENSSNNRTSLHSVVRNDDAPFPVQLAGDDDLRTSSCTPPAMPIHVDLPCQVPHDGARVKYRYLGDI